MGTPNVCRHSGLQTTEATRQALRSTAAALRVDLVEVEVSNERDITAAITEMRSRGIQALTVTPTPLLRNHAALLAELALQQRLPYAGVDGDAERGGLLGFSSDKGHVNPSGRWRARTPARR